MRSSSIHRSNRTYVCITTLADATPVETLATTNFSLAVLNSASTTCHNSVLAHTNLVNDDITSSSAMAERPRELGDFKKARVNGGTDNQSLKDSQFPEVSPQPLTDPHHMVIK